jgi:hypothetical protein
MTEHEAIFKKWDAVWGDRQHELVVIGLEMDQSVVRKTTGSVPAYTR